MNTFFKKRRKKAVSSIIGGLFVLAIMILGLVSVVYVSSLENNVHAAENNVAQIDVARNQERLNVLNTFLGATQIYTPSQAYVTSGGCTNICGVTMNVGNGFRYDNTEWCANAPVCGVSNYTLGTLEPGYAPLNVTSATRTVAQETISNMNFTSNIDGWATYTTSSQVTGGYSSTEGNGVPGSGVGSLFIGAIFLSGATVSGNESTRFYLDPTGTGTGTFTGASFSFAEFFSQSLFTSASLKSYTYNVYLVDESTGSNNLILTKTVSAPGSADTQWNYDTGITTLANGNPIDSVLTQKGYYDLVLQTTITFSNKCGPNCSQFFGYFDDVGLSISYNSFVTDWTYTFEVNQTAASVQELSFSITTSYNQTNVLQSIYVYDWVLNKYDLFSTTTASTGSTTVSFTVNVTNTGQFSAQNLVSNTGKVILRIYSIRPSAPNTGAQGDNMQVSVSSVNGLLMSLSYTTQNSFTLVVQNGGPQPLHIIALVIVDSNGHTYINATGALMYNGSFNSTLTFDQVIFPLQTVNVQVNYRWSVGLINIYLLTSLGNVFSTSTIAS